MQWFKSLVVGSAIALAAVVGMSPQASRAEIIDYFQMSPMTWVYPGPGITFGLSLLNGHLQIDPEGPGAVMALRPPVGNPLLPDFSYTGIPATLTGDLHVVDLSDLSFVGLFPLALLGTVDADTTDETPGPGTFPIEIVQMSLTGFAGSTAIELRENSGLPSLGEVTDTGLHVDSFFDIFVEISVQNFGFVPQEEQAGTRFATVPEPLSAALFGMALLGFAALRRRNG